MYGRERTDPKEDLVYVSGTVAPETPAPPVRNPEPKVEERVDLAKTDRDKKRRRPVRPEKKPKRKTKIVKKKKVVRKWKK